MHAEEIEQAIHFSQDGAQLGDADLSAGVFKDVGDERRSVLMGAAHAKTRFAGLSECQSRQVEALHFHWNMALMAVSATRLSQLRDQRASPLVFNMDDEKRRASNEFFAEKILGIVSQEQTGQKCEDLLADLLSLGVKAA